MFCLKCFMEDFKFVLVFEIGKELLMLCCLIELKAVKILPGEKSNQKLSRSSFWAPFIFKNLWGGCSPAIQFSNTFLIWLFCKNDCHEVGACQPQIFTVCSIWWFCLREKKKFSKVFAKEIKQFSWFKCFACSEQIWRFWEIHPKFSKVAFATRY